MAESDANAGWGGGSSDKKKDVFEETDPLELMRLQTMHLQRIRGYIGFTMILILIQAAFIVLWLLGAITIEFKPVSTSPF